MKIIIVGSGIAGLSTYLALRKHFSSGSDGQLDQDIVIVESHDIAQYLSDSTESASTSSAPKSVTPHHTSAAASGAQPDEPAFTPEAIGLAIGIAKNGLAVLGRLSSDDKGSFTLVEDVLKAGHAITKWTLSNARGWTLATLESVSASNGTGDDPKANARGQWQEEGRVKGDEIQTVMISRQAMWKILLNHVVRLGGAAVIKQKKVVKVGLCSPDAVDRPQLFYEDGSTESADLIIGADGFESAVRRVMFSSSIKKTGDSRTGTRTRRQFQGVCTWLRSFVGASDPHSSQDYVTPQYKGVSGVGGFIPASLLTSNHHPPNTMSVVFGPNGFFGYGYITSATPLVEHAEAGSPGPVAVYWSTFSSPSTQAPLLNSKEERNAAIQTLLARYRSWRNPSIQSILSYAEHNGVDGCWPTYTTPPLPHWSENGCIVLVGDAAHALQPSSGQGASQAMEDAEALAMMLAYYLKDLRCSNESEREMMERSAVAQALSKFEQLRMPRVKMIWEKSQRISKMKADMGLVQEMLMYFFIWLMSRFQARENEKLVNYDLPKEVAELLQDNKSSL